MKNRMKNPRSAPVRASITGAVSAVLISAAATLVAKPSWAPAPPDVIMSPGITAATCSAQKRDPSGAPVAATDAYVFGMFDLRTPSAPDYTTLGAGATMWNAAMWHHSTWSVQEMGCVFGIATDPDGNTYTAANGLWAPTYSPSAFGDPYLQYGDIGRAGSDELGASGTIYKTDALTGVATVFARIPQVTDPNLPIDPGPGGVRGGPGMGNITVDYLSGNLFATSLDDGKIYQFDPSGGSLGTFDPFGSEASPTPGMIPLGERLFAIEAHDGKLYFSVWNGGTVASPNEIWSVDLPGGLIDGSSLAQELVVPASFGASGADSVTVSDLSFSADGTVMLLGERAYRNYGYYPGPGGMTFSDYYCPHNHRTSARKAEFVSGSWTMTCEVATGGGNPTGEAYGGVEFGFEAGSPEQVIWMSSADIATYSGPHGLQGMRMTDFPPFTGTPVQVSDSFVVPYVAGAGPGGPDFKGMGGDVETMKTGDDCARVIVEEVLCPTVPGGPYTVTLSVENLQPKPITSYGAVPTPASALSPGAIGIQPQPMGWQALPSPLNQGDVTTITFDLPGLSGGEFACFNLTFLDAKFEECCTETVCVDIPKCECALVHDIQVNCRQLPDGTWVYDLDLTVENTSNLIGAPLSAYGISFGPNVTAFSPNYIDLSGSPFNPGDTQTFSTTYTGPSGLLCFKIALHTEGNEECCFVEDICVDLPPCGGDEPIPDCCMLTPSMTYCCPLTDDGLAGLNGAKIRYTICNKSNEEKTYDWSIENLGPGTITFVQFDPALGMILVAGGTIGPVPPGGCASIEVIIRCELEPGECAKYAIRTSAGPGSPELVCRGEICEPEPGTVVIKGPDDPTTDLGPGEVLPYEYHLVNSSDELVEIPVEISSSYGVVGISLTRDEVGDSALVTNVKIPANSEVPLVVYLRRLDGEGLLPIDSVNLFANAGQRGPNGSDDHVSSIMLEHSRGVPFRVIDLDCLNLEGGEFVKLDLFLERGPMEMAIEEFNLTTRQWEMVPVRSGPDDAVNQGSIILAAGQQVIYSPRMNQARGIFRVICLDEPGN